MANPTPVPALPPAPASGPELLDVPVAVWALGLSLLSLGIAIAALGWQVAKHFLDGGRVKVYLNAAVWEPEVSLFTVTNGNFGLPNENAARTVTHGRGLELAQLVVENPGRVPVTIHSPGLYITGHGKKNHSVSPRSFSTGESFGHDEATTDRTVRLEPYARVTFLLDYLSVVPSMMKDPKVKKIELRGQVGVAGRSSRPQRSSSRRKWAIERGTYTAIEGSPPFTPYAVLWRELYVQLPVGDDPDRHPNSGRAITRGEVSYILDEAMSRFEKRPEREELQRVVEELAEKRGDRFPMVGFGLYEGYEALDMMAGHLTPWTEGLRFRRIAANRKATEELRQMDAAQASRAAAIASDVGPLEQSNSGSSEEDPPVEQASDPRT
ncbi:hypothetical protein ACWFOS_16280 [Gordonia terrae]